MKIEKVLIVGANGFLGRKLLLRFHKDYETFGTDVVVSGIDKKYQPVPIDITNYQNVQDVYSAIQPDLTILTAAMTDVDVCEEKPELAYKINAIGPQNIAQVIKMMGGRLIFISTDFIFDGNDGNYSESDIPNPINVYGKSKLDGENLIRNENIPSIICRTSVLFGWPQSDQRDNFFSWAYKQIQANKTIHIVKNQIVTPTLVDDLVEFLFQISKFSNSEVYHTTGPESISRYDFIRKMIDIFGKNHLLLKEAPSINQKAKRPENSSLNTRKIQTLNLYSFRNVNDSFIFLKNKKS